MPVLRNIWAWLHAEVMVQPRRGTLHLRPALLRLDRQLMWLMLEVAKHYRLWRHMPTYRDLYFQCPMPRWRAAADDLGRLVKPPAPEGDITVRHMLLPGLLLIAVSALVWSPMQ